MTGVNSVGVYHGSALHPDSTASNKLVILNGALRFAQDKLRRVKDYRLLNRDRSLRSGCRDRKTHSVSLKMSGARGRHVNVLRHLMGFLKNPLSGEDKQELLGLIEDHRQGLVPLTVPLTQLRTGSSST